MKLFSGDVGIPTRAGGRGGRKVHIGKLGGVREREREWERERPGEKGKRRKKEGEGEGGREREP